MNLWFCLFVFATDLFWNPVTFGRTPRLWEGPDWSQSKVLTLGTVRLGIVRDARVLGWLLLCLSPHLVEHRGYTGFQAPVLSL